MPLIRLDDLDHQLLAELLHDGRASYQELARRVGLSPTAVADRVRRLVTNQVIVGFHAEIDPAMLGRNVEAIIDARLATPEVRPAFAQVIAGHPAVLDATHVTGTYDYLIRVVCTGTAELDQLLDVLKAEGGVVESQTRLLLHRLPGGGIGQPQPPPTVPAGATSPTRRTA